MKKFSLSLCLFVLPFITGCGNSDPDLVGTWVLQRGEDIRFLPQNRSLSFQFHTDENRFEYRYSNMEIQPDPLPIDGREDRLVFKENGEYILFHGGIAFGRDQLSDGLPGYESGFFTTDKDKITFTAQSRQGFPAESAQQRRSADKKGGEIKFQYKIENDYLAIMWDHLINAPLVNGVYVDTRVNGKLTFKRVSSGYAEVRSYSIPDLQFDDTKATSFYGLSLPSNMKEDTKGHALNRQKPSIDTLFGFTIPAKQRSYLTVDPSKELPNTKVFLNLILLNRIKPEEYKKYITTKYQNFGFSKPINGKYNSWDILTFDKAVDGKIVTRQVEAIQAHTVNNIERTYVVEGYLEHPRVDLRWEELIANKFYQYLSSAEFK